MEILLFLILPVSSIILLFLKDANNKRRRVMNVLLILNAILFLIPIMLAYSNTPAGESIWNENTGGGAALWLYMLVFPLSGIIQLVLLILKIVFATSSK